MLPKVSESRSEGASAAPRIDDAPRAASQATPLVESNRLADAATDTVAKASDPTPRLVPLSLAKAATSAVPQLRASEIQPAPIPETPRVDVRDDYHGTLVRDPYRWLERPVSQDQSVIDHQEHRIEKWVGAQNARFVQWMGQFKAIRSYVGDRIYELQDRPRKKTAHGSPLGKVQWRKAGAEDSWKLYLTPKAKGDTKPQEEVLLDTAAIAQALGQGSETRITAESFSPSGRYLALKVSEFQEDWERIAIFDTEKRALVGAPLEGVKWSGLSWLGEDEILYASYDNTAEGRAKNAPDVNQRLRLHKVGEAQASDRPLFPTAPGPFAQRSVWMDGDYVVREESAFGSTRTQISIAKGGADELKSGKLDFFPLVDAKDGLESTLGFLDDSDRFFVQTREQEDGSMTTGRLAYVDIKDPQRKLKTLIPVVPGRELEQVVSAGDALVLSYEVDLGDRLSVCDMDGKLRYEVDFAEQGLPPGIASGFRYDAKTKSVTFDYSSVLMPSASYKLDLATGKVSSVEPSNLPFNGAKLTYERVEYPSKDGTVVPMLLVHAKDGYEKNGQQPTLLYGYGGFEADVNDLHFVREELIPFIEAGGTLALPVLRGGAELGDAWHRDGMRDKKQHVFDDFVGAAEYLVREGYTTPKKIGALGYSNGGLLVGAAITQRPDLFGAAVPANGVQDMLRFSKFSSGKAWENEYGDVTSEKDFRTLYAYSPVHNVRAADYPATLVYTGAHDTRVDPAASWKLAAELQHEQESKAPIFVYTNPDTAHFSNLDAKRLAEVTGLRIGFIMAALGMQAPAATSAGEAQAAAIA